MQWHIEERCLGDTGGITINQHVGPLGIRVEPHTSPPNAFIQNVTRSMLEQPKNQLRVFGGGNTVNPPSGPVFSDYK